MKDPYPLLRNIALVLVIIVLGGAILYGVVVLGMLAVITLRQL
jgi:hypothetical protein